MNMKVIMDIVKDAQQSCLAETFRFWKQEEASDTVIKVDDFTRVRN